MSLAKNPSEMQERAEASFKRKEIQARDGKKAMAEYEAAGKASREKTAKLKLLREAKEAADREAAQQAASLAKLAAAAKKRR
jgi:hypothetical protein